MADAKLLVAKLPAEFATQRPSVARAASVLVGPAVKRLRIVTLLFLGVWLPAWITFVTIEGSWANELREPGQWGPAVLILGASVIMLLIAFRAPLPPLRIIHIGLAYQVVISFGLAAMSYVGVFADVPAEVIHEDRVGLTVVVLLRLDLPSVRTPTALSARRLT